MGKIVGKVTDAVGLTDNKGAASAAKASAAAGAAATAMSKEQIEFAKKQYEDWKKIYGPIETNLGEYYKNLTPEKLTSLGLQNQQKEFQIAQAATAQDMAQRGITDSGIDIAAQTNLKFQNATARATIRTDAEQKVAEQKLQFLGVGLGQGSGLLANVGNASATAVGAQTSLANAARSQYTSLSTANMSAMGDLVGAGAFLATGGYGK